MCVILFLLSLFFFFNDTATTEIYTLSLHDALPISCPCPKGWCIRKAFCKDMRSEEHTSELQSRFGISYAVFCLKKKKKALTATQQGTRLQRSGRCGSGQR